MSAWIKKAKSGKPFMSIAFQAKEDQTGVQESQNRGPGGQTPVDESDIPF